MIIKKSIFFSISLYVCFAGNSQQIEQQLDSSLVKKLLYHSFVCDRKYALPDNYVIQFDNYYSDFEKFRYFKSEKLELHISPYSRRESRADVYSIQLFKYYGQPDEPYFVLKIERCQNIYFHLDEDVWIRVSGFSESDIKLLFDFWGKDQKLTIEDIRNMVDSWQQGDGMFNEVDWDCLIDGYLTNNIKRKCYLSWSKVNLEASVYGTDICPSILDLHSSFSESHPLCGMLR